ncbi:hypothetical protein [Neptuniibacter sp.]|uniref:hypothetical protein n=1 Tax=Neptuniibacter sp. TaxID=1962643 RepID=UPI00261E1265|nr:hypothetical protein [Neptuniibacter sp.]MCP4594854.1 hypothetical protein [Neptuniibacter sp.]
MGKRISDWLHHVSTGWVTLIAVIIFLLFSVLVMPRQAVRSEADVGSVESPDMSFYYSSDNLYRIAKEYGEQGRRAYVRARLTFDVIWPLVYTAFLGTTISWVYGKAFTANSRWQRANLVPVLGTLFDYLENLTTSIVMLRYPQPTMILASLAGVMTTVKWIFVNGSFMALLVGVVVGVWGWIRRRG